MLFEAESQEFKIEFCDDWQVNARRLVRIVQSAVELLRSKLKHSDSGYWMAIILPKDFDKYLDDDYPAETGSVIGMITVRQKLYSLGYLVSITTNDIVTPIVYAVKTVKPVIDNVVRPDTLDYERF